MTNKSYLKWIEISKSALLHNIAVFNKISASGSQAMAVVKSNAYGHGIEEVASIAEGAGVSWFGVNELSEGLILRNVLSEKASILIMGAIDPATAIQVVQNELKTIVYTDRIVEALAQASSRLKKQCVVHVKVETGLQRQGIVVSKLANLIKKINNASFLTLEGLSTHFANIEDTTDHTYAYKQLAVFNEAIEIAKSLCEKELVVHCACSAAALAVPETGFSLFRMGIGMYGMWPSKETQLSVLKDGGGKNLELRPPLTFKCKIGQVKDVQTGSLIGYGCTEQATHNLKIAVLPVGYYDGIDRGLSSKGQVLVNGKTAYIRGRICMNMCMIDVTHIEKVKEGDEVIILGSDGKKSVSADFVASQIDTINYEVVTRLGAHLPRLVVD